MTENIINFQNSNNFEFETPPQSPTFSEKIHIRIQQRNAKKVLTTVQGINSKINLKLLLKEFKKNFSCNGTIIDDDEKGQIIQLQGDKRVNISEFLIKEKIYTKEEIVIHGY